MKLSLISLALWIFNPLFNIHAQTISFGYGSNYTLSNMSEPLANGGDYYDNTDYSFKFQYHHYLKREKLSISADFTTYDGATFIPFKKGTVLSQGGFPRLAVGYSGVSVRKLIVGINYNLLNPKSKFLLIPSIGIGVQQSRENGWEFLQRDDHVNGPDYVQTEPLRGEPLNTTQIIPTIGLKTGIIFWKRLEFGLDIQGVYAFKSYQNMYLDYEYLGEPQPTAVYETTGTGIFTAIFLGYRIKKLSR